MSHPPKSPSPGAGALSRFTVLDLTRVRSGPTAVRQLADWGARVIRIEAPDEANGRDPLGGQRGGPDFQNLHRNKRSLTLNLKAPGGVDILKRLAKGADVVVENFRPDVKHRLGVDYESLKAINPGIVYASISGFGQDGPYAERPGFDQVAQGMGGLMSITGLPGQGPVRAGIPIADLCAGIFCAQGILVALLERDATGLGQWVQTSLLQAQIFMLDFQGSRWLNQGKVPGQTGNNHPTSIPTGVFETSDGHINVAASGQLMWERLCKALGAPELMQRPEYTNGGARSTNRDQLNDELNVYLRTDTSARWIDRLNEAGVPCGPIYGIDEVFADPQAQHLGVATSVQSPVRGEVKLLAQPMTLSRTPSAMTLPPPEAGEHTDEILEEFGYSTEEIQRFRAAEVI